MSGATKEVGAPETRITVPLELVLTPRGKDLIPVLGPVVTAPPPRIVSTRKRPNNEAPNNAMSTGVVGRRGADRVIAEPDMTADTMRALFLAGGVTHFAIGLFALVAPRWFFDAAPPWPPLHIGQIQIAATFDLAMATLFLCGASDPARFAPIVVAVGVVAEWGHAAVRIGHVLAGDNPATDLFLPLLMVLFGALLLALAVRAQRRRT